MSHEGVRQLMLRESTAFERVKPPPVYATNPSEDTLADSGSGWVMVEKRDQTGAVVKATDPGSWTASGGASFLSLNHNRTPVPPEERLTI